MKKYENIYNTISTDKAKPFVKLAEYVVDYQCQTLEGNKIEGTQRTNLIETYSMDLLLGSTFTKNKYIAIGIICGVTVTTLGFVLKDKIKNKTRK